MEFHSWFFLSAFICKWREINFTPKEVEFQPSLTLHICWILSTFLCFVMSLILRLVGFSLCNYRVSFSSFFVFCRNAILLKIYMTLLDSRFHCVAFLLLPVFIVTHFDCFPFSLSLFFIVSCFHCFPLSLFLVFTVFRFHSFSFPLFPRFHSSLCWSKASLAQACYKKVALRTSVWMQSWADRRAWQFVDKKEKKEKKHKCKSMRINTYILWSKHYQVYIYTSLRS